MRLATAALIFLMFTGSAKAEIVSHPAGCPYRAFCGCGASVFLFGRPIRSLWPARAWYGFHRATPGYRMAGVRAHHIVVLLQQVRGSVWLVYDANSGHHATRVHERDISRFTIVDPHA